MNKFEYFKKAIKAKCYNSKAWIISILAITQEDPESYIKNPYAYKVVQMPTGFSFVDPENEGRLTKIDTDSLNVPLFTPRDVIEIDSSICPNALEPVTTTIGGVLFNVISLVESFGDKIPYQNGLVSISKIENMIAQKLRDTPEDGAERSKDVFYVDELLAFNKSISFLENLSQLCVYAATPKNIVAPPEIDEKKMKLIQEYGDRLSDPVILAEYESKLKAIDAEWLKDDPSYGILMSGKITNMSRKGMFLTVGAGHGFKESTKVTPVLNSLQDGWPKDPDQFTAMINVSRAGSFFRGSDTVKGGVSAKALLRAISNFVIMDEDCGASLGFRKAITEKNYKKLVGRYCILQNTRMMWTLIESTDQAKEYIGKTLIVRSPLYCKLKEDTVCRYCAGENLFRNPVGLTSAATEISSIILATSLAQFHGTMLATNKYNYMDALT